MRLAGGLGGDSRLPKEPKKKGAAALAAVTGGPPVFDERGPPPRYCSHAHDLATAPCRTMHVVTVQIHAVSHCCTQRHAAGMQLCAAMALGTAALWLRYWQHGSSNSMRLVASAVSTRTRFYFNKVVQSGVGG